MDAPAVDRLPERLHAALVGAAAGEDAGGTPAGVRRLLDTAEALAASGGRLDEAAARAAGLGEPAVPPAALVLPAVVAGLVSPLDRPRLRLAAHRLARLGRGDEGTAMTAVAVAVLAADLCRFDLATALVRLRQTLLEEAPSALHLRLRPLDPWDPRPPADDPGAALQLAITALAAGDDIPGVVAAAAGPDDGGAAALAGALAGARSGLDGVDADLLERLPAAPRIAALAARLAAVGESLPPLRRGLDDVAAAVRRLGAGGPAAEPGTART